MLDKQTKVRSHDDILNAYHAFSYRWMDFISACPDLLNISWFYEGNDVSDAMALEMRRLISVLVMLYGTDLIRVILSVLDYPLANQLRNYILSAPAEVRNEDMRVLVMEMLLHLLRRHDRRETGSLDNSKRDKFIMMMEVHNVPYFEVALDKASFRTPIASTSGD